MNNLFKELKGKDIKIKTWEEMLSMKNTTIHEDEIQTSILFSDKDGAFINFTDSMKYLCGKIIHVDETMMPDCLFKEVKELIEIDRELLYFDKARDRYYYLDKDMFNVLETQN